MLDGNTAAEIQNDRIAKSNPERLAEKLIALEGKLARDIEKYTHEAICEVLLSDNEETLSRLKLALYNDDQELWVSASKELFLDVRNYVHNI